MQSRQNHPSTAAEGSTLGRIGRRMRGDLAYLLPGPVFGIAAFAALVPLLSLSLGTLIIWVGALLLPITLRVANWFADISRNRARTWGVEIPDTQSRTRAPGFGGLMREVRRTDSWRDLVFEMLLAMPLRLVTGILALVWPLVAIGGLSYWAWSWSLPDGGSGLAELTLLMFPDAALVHALGTTLFDVIVNFLLGAIFLVTSPAVLHGLAWLDAHITKFALAAEGWIWLLTGIASVTLMSVSWPVLAAIYGVHVAIAMVLAVAISGAVVVAVRLPLTAVVLSAIGLFATALVTAPAASLPWPVPVASMVAAMLVVAIVGFRQRWYAAALAWLAMTAASLAGALFGAGGGTSGAMSNFTIFAAIGAGVVVLVAVVRQLLSSRGEVKEIRAVSEQERRKRAEVEERNRISQELHDVVAHSLSVTSVQATTAKYRIPGLSPEVAAEFDAIADSSRRALGEMRGLLRLLRGDGDADLAPQPTLSELPALIASSRASGAVVEYVERLGDKSPEEIPASVGLATYRIVQESISNALRHMHGSTIRVTVVRASDALEVEVRNGPADAQQPIHATPGAGLGLSGLRGRTEALGGTFAAGHEPDGGFAVRARLPIE